MFNGFVIAFVTRKLGDFALTDHFECQNIVSKILCQQPTLAIPNIPHHIVLGSVENYTFGRCVNVLRLVNDQCLLSTKKRPFKESSIYFYIAAENSSFELEINLTKRCI